MPGEYIAILGITALLSISYALSNNKKLINIKLVLKGLLFQALIGIFILKTNLGKSIFEIFANGVTAVLELSKAGGQFVFGFLTNQEILQKSLHIEKEYSFIFSFQVIPAIIFICSLVSCLYYFGILQNIIKVFAYLFNKFLGVSGAEALANTSVVIVGQVESAIVIQPYLAKMTKSEILTIMTGGMACISGSLLAIYSSLGIPIEYLLSASFMSIPGAFVISKIIYPEDEKPVTKDTVKIEYKPKENSFIEAILDGAFAGAKISIGIIAMLIAFISLVALIDKFLFLLNNELSLKLLLGWLFTPIVYLFGIPKDDIQIVAQLLGTKISLNEFIAYIDFSKLLMDHKLSEKSILITSFILCGFANFGSIAIQVGGLSQMAPERKSDFAKLGFKAMIAGVIVSCLSGTIAGMII